MSSNKKLPKDSLQRALDEILNADKQGVFKRLSSTKKKEWLAHLKSAINHFNKKNFLVFQSKALKQLRQAYSSYIYSGFAKNNKGLKGWRVNEMKPILRKQLRNHISESLLLIKTQNSYRMNILESRFLDWLSHKEVDAKQTPLREVMQVDKTIRKTDKHYNMILQDQTRKMIGGFDYVVAQHYKAIGFYWRTRQDNKVVGNPVGKYPDAGNKMHQDHYSRNGKFYFYKDNWAVKQHLINTKHKDFAYADFVDGLPGQPINCRCYAHNIYDLDDVPKNLVIENRVLS